MSTTNPAIANVSRAGELSDFQDDAIAALISLDSSRLEEVAGRVSALIAGLPVQELSQDTAYLRELEARHRLMGTLLASTDLNLQVLERLHNRHQRGETSWVR